MANPIVDTVSGYLPNIFNITFLVLFGLVILGAVIGIIYYFVIYPRKFNITVKINSDRSNEQSILWDKAGILYDRANKSKYFKLLKGKFELEAPPFRILQSTNKGDYLELWRKSEDEFAFLTKPKIDKEWIVRADGKLYPIARMKQRQVEADWYWIAKRKQEDRGWISPEGFFTKFVQMLPIIIPSVFMLIILFVFLDRLPGILASLADLIEKANKLYGVASTSP